MINFVYKWITNKGFLHDKIKRFTYEGGFADDKMHGMGKYTFLNLPKDNVFEGNFINDEPEGK